LFVMKHTKFSWIMMCLALLPGVSSGARAQSKPVMVHYMPWFVSRPYTGRWGWHWTMNHYNPDVIDADGQREIASWYYPLIDPYDSLDPAALEYHVLLMKLGGIDGVIVDWYGMDNFNDYAVNNQRTLALLNYTRKAGLKFSHRPRATDPALRPIQFLRRSLLPAARQPAGLPQFRPAIFHGQLRLGVHLLGSEREQSAGFFHRGQPPAGRRGCL
jgi:hypothetical protein